MKDNPQNQSILVKDSQYEGQYVAFKSICDRTIISHGKDPDLVFEEAVKKGHDSPLLLFVPEQGITCCY